MEGIQEQGVNKTLIADEDICSGATKANRTALTEAESYLVCTLFFPYLILTYK